MAYFGNQTIRMFLFASVMTVSQSLYAQETGLPDPTATRTSSIILQNLPRTCLPDRIDPNADRNNDSTCHCPPLQMCSETVMLSGNTYPKLPQSIRNVCCPPPSPPPPPPPPPQPAAKVNPPTAECEISYTKGVDYACVSNTVIGARTARFCSKFSGTNPSVINLNNCLQTQCSSIANDIRTDDRLRSDIGYLTSLGQAAIEWFMIGPGWDHKDIVIKQAIRFNDYIKCRQTCFMNNGAYNDLMSNKEKELNQWILLPTHDNFNDKTYYSHMKRDSNFIEIQLLHNNVFHSKGKALAGTVTKSGRYSDNIYHALQLWIAENDPPELKHFTSKLYGSVAHATINQTVWPLFFNNTYAPYKLGHSAYNYQSITDFDDIPDVNNLGRNSNPNIKVTSDYFVGKIQSKNFKKLSDVTTDNPAQIFQEHSATGMYAGTNCTEYDDFNICIATAMNNGSCDSCLSPETKITLGDTSIKAIKDLKAGDSVKVPHDKTAVIDEVVKIEWPELVLYNINDGALKLTPDHPVMTTKGWRAINYNARKDGHSDERYGLDYDKVATLKVGDVIVTEQGELPVTRIMPEPTQKNGVTFNLRLKNAKSFYANGLLVKSNR